MDQLNRKSYKALNLQYIIGHNMKENNYTKQFEIEPKLLGEHYAN